MIIDKDSLNKFGSIPERVFDIAKLAQEHGRKFSQSKDCLFISYEKKFEIDGWMISDSSGKKIYASIFYSDKEDKFYVLQNKSIYEYSNNENVLIHANEFFMPEITDRLITID